MADPCKQAAADPGVELRSRAHYTSGPAVACKCGPCPGRCAPPYLRSVNRIALGRLSERGSYDFATIAAILDEGLTCHVGVTSGNKPVVIPTIYGRIEDALYIHGSVLARWMSESCDRDVCVTVSIVDALVLARCAYQHSLNYRSVVAFGRAQAVDDPNEKTAALRAIVEHVCCGRWQDVRPPNSTELKATLVLRIPLNAASAKIRTGPPIDFEKDMASGVWAGLVPLENVRGEPIPDSTLAAGISIPAYLR